MARSSGVSPASLRASPSATVNIGLLSRLTRKPPSVGFTEVQPSPGDASAAYMRCRAPSTRSSAENAPCDTRKMWMVRCPTISATAVVAGWAATIRPGNDRQATNSRHAVTMDTTIALKALGLERSCIVISQSLSWLQPKHGALYEKWQAHTEGDEHSSAPAR